MESDPVDGGMKQKKGMATFCTVWAGQLVSMLGSGLTSFGLMVWLYEKTQAATPYALAFLTSVLPAIVFAPFAGHFADRRSRKKVIILADSGDAVVTLAVLILAATKRLEPWMVYIIAFFSSSFECFQGAAWASAVPTIVPKAKLGKANGLSSVSEALASLIPPLVAGLLFDRIGLSGLIAIDFATYFFALAGILAVKIPRVQAVETGKTGGSVLADAAFGFRYLREKKGMLGLVIYYATVNFFANFAMVLLGPMVIPASGTSGLGIVQTAMGAGALSGGLACAIWGGPKRKRIPFIMLCIAVASLGLAATGLRASVVLESAGLFVLLFAVQMSNSVPLFQTKIEAGAQGRTKAARSMISMSLMPLAFLSAGPLSDYVFEPCLKAGGALASGPVGALMGTGPGRGTGFLFVLAGACLLAVTAIVRLMPGIRDLDERLPDLV